MNPVTFFSRARLIYKETRARKSHRIHFQWSRGLKKQERYVKISKFVFLWNLFDFSSFLFRGPPCAFPLAPHFPKFCLAFISKAARRGLRLCKTLFFLCENRDKQRPGNLETLFVLPEYLLYNITRKNIKILKILDVYIFTPFSLFFQAPECFYNKLPSFFKHPRSSKVNPVTFFARASYI